VHTKQNKEKEKGGEYGDGNLKREETQEILAHA